MSVTHLLAGCVIRYHPATTNSMPGVTHRIARLQGTCTKCAESARNAFYAMPPMMSTPRSPTDTRLVALPRTMNPRMVRQTPRLMDPVALTYPSLSRNARHIGGTHLVPRLSSGAWVTCHRVHHALVARAYALGEQCAAAVALYTACAGASVVGYRRSWMHRRSGFMIIDLAHAAPLPGAARFPVI